MQRCFAPGLSVIILRLAHAAGDHSVVQLKAELTRRTCIEEGPPPHLDGGLPLQHALQGTLLLPRACLRHYLGLGYIPSQTHTGKVSFLSGR